MLLNFRQFVIEEAVNFAQAIELYGLKQGDVVDGEDLKNKYRKFALQYHPDRNRDSGAEEKFKQAKASYDLLEKMIGQTINVPRQTSTQNWQSWQPNPTEILKNEVKDRLTRAIEEIRAGRPESVPGLIAQLVDPHTGKLNNPAVKPILKTGLQNLLRLPSHDQVASLGFILAKLNDYFV
jgi:hypothetical protein